jgi:hypothetical protein
MWGLRYYVSKTWHFVTSIYACYTPTLLLFFFAKAQIYRNFKRSRFDLPGFIRIAQLISVLSLWPYTLSTHCPLRFYFLSKAFLRVTDNYTCYSREIRPRLFLCHCKLCHTHARTGAYTHTHTHTHRGSYSILQLTSRSLWCRNLVMSGVKPGTPFRP